jgi:hypothetical protein
MAGANMVSVDDLQMAATNGQAPEEPGEKRDYVALQQITYLHESYRTARFANGTAMTAPGYSHYGVKSIRKSREDLP